MGTRDGSRRQHLLGIGLVLAAALAFSLAGVLTKMISADVWTILCWRGLIGGLLIALYVGCTARAATWRRTFRLGRGGWLLASVGSLASVAFIHAFKLTHVAHVAVIYATAPFIAAGLAWLLLGERFRRRTAAAATACVAGVGILVAGTAGSGTLTGDVMALLMTVGCALYMVLIRVFRDGGVVWAGGVSALQLFAVGWLFADPLAVGGRDALFLGLFGLAFAVATILWTEGTKRLPAAESALFGAAETPLAVLMAWWLLAELPPPASFLGGAVVLAAVLAHAAADLRGRRPEPVSRRPVPQPAQATRH